MTRWLWLILLLLGIGFKANALNAVLSHSIFYMPAADGHTPYAEVYWQIEPESIVFKELSAGQFTGRIKTEVRLLSDTGVVASDRYILQTDPFPNVQAAQRQSIIELHRYKLPAGKILVQLYLSDLADPANTLALTDSFTVERMADKPIYSTIQLLDTSYTSVINSVFSKNNRQQIPLSANFLDKWRHTLHFYMELYNTTHLTKEDTPLIQTTYISKKERSSPIYDLKQTDTLRRGDVRPLLGSFDVSKLPTGNYYINAVLQSKDKQRLAEKSSFFQVVNELPEDTISNANMADSNFEKLNFVDLSTTFVGKFTLKQVMAILVMIRPIASAIERDAIDNFEVRPDDNYMRYFVYNFWKERNPKDPKKAWDAYTDKIKEVNKMFRGELYPGYQTDRGQVYLRYGKPNDIITVNNEQGVLPYEIWVYNALPEQSLGGLFLFYRPADYVSGYRLLHSNVRGELRNPSWRNYLYTVSGSSSGNTNARAEQYFSGNK
jgi:GWxTD domain-containing protein